jgi:low temperature requirement protein LtrA
VDSSARLPILRAGDGSVSTVELFFDLVYVFAITQLSHLLVRHPTWDGALYALVLLAMVWQVWVYTTWAANYLDPARAAVRAMLLAVMLASLVLAAELNEGFGSRGLTVAVTYVVIQVGRCLFMVVVLRGDALFATFARILPWSMLSGGVVVAGAFVHGHGRAGLWALAVAMDLVAAAFGFRFPGLGRSVTSEWTISGSHFAERCQGFVLIALGESIVVIGARLASLSRPSAAEIAAFVIAFAGSATLWWIYFDRAAADSAEAIAASGDPGRLARDAFHWVHPLIVAGIVVGAAADEVVLSDPHRRGSAAVGWLVLGGVALYLVGHTVFKAVVWRVISWPRVVGAAVALLLLLLAPHVSALTLAVLALVVLVLVAATSRIPFPRA